MNVLQENWIGDKIRACKGRDQIATLGSYLMWGTWFRNQRKWRCSSISFRAVCRNLMSLKKNGTTSKLTNSLINHQQTKVKNLKLQISALTTESIRALMQANYWINKVTFHLSCNRVKTCLNLFINSNWTTSHHNQSRKEKETKSNQMWLGWSTENNLSSRTSLIKLSRVRGNQCCNHLQPTIMLRFSKCLMSSTRQSQHLLQSTVSSSRVLMHRSAKLLK